MDENPFIEKPRLRSAKRASRRKSRILPREEDEELRAPLSRFSRQVIH